MRKLVILLVFWFEMAAAPVRAQGPRDGGARVAGSDEPLVVRAATGALHLRRPYARGKVPVVFIHGLWATPRSWDGMIVKLESEPSLRDGYQFWAFGYATGDSIPYSAFLLRRSLESARRRFDPDQSDSSFDRMVLIGHSMGGLLAKMMVVDSGTGFWRDVSDRPFEQLVGEPEDRELFAQALLVKPLPEVRRVVFIATPHRGSKLNGGWVRGLGARLVNRSEPMRLAHDRLIARNNPGFFKEDFRRGAPSSIDELGWDAPFLRSLHELAAAPDVNLHSVIAVRADLIAGEQSDGLVSVASAHLDGASSEVVISAGHLCQDHPFVIREVKRVLVEHAGL